MPAVRVEVDAELEAVDDELAGLELLAHLEHIHLGLEVLHSPSRYNSIQWRISPDRFKSIEKVAFLDYSQRKYLNYSQSILTTGDILKPIPFTSPY